MLAFTSLKRVLAVLAVESLQAELNREQADPKWFIESEEWELPSGEHVKPPKEIGSARFYLSHEVPARHAFGPDLWMRVPQLLREPPTAVLWKSE
jgi:hypothetical protein